MRMVEGINLHTRRTAVVHINDLKIVRRPSLFQTSVKKATMRMIDEEKEFADLRGRRIVSYPDIAAKDEVMFVDLEYARDFGEIISQCKIKGTVLVALPEWQEEDFFAVHEMLHGVCVEVPGNE